MTPLSLQGFKIDVIPEFLFFDRHRPNGRKHVTDDYLSIRRVLRVLEETLRVTGLAGLAPLARRLQNKIDDNAGFDGNQIHEITQRIKDLEAEKGYWMGETETWRQHAKRADEAFVEHQAWIAELETTSDWNDDHRRHWLRIAEERAIEINELERRLTKLKSKRRR